MRRREASAGVVKWRLSSVGDNLRFLFLEYPYAVQRRESSFGDRSHLGFRAADARLEKTSPSTGGENVPYRTLPPLYCCFLERQRKTRPWFIEALASLRIRLLFSGGSSCRSPFHASGSPQTKKTEIPSTEDIPVPLRRALAYATPSLTALNL